MYCAYELDTTSLHARTSSPARFPFLSLQAERKSASPLSIQSSWDLLNIVHFYIQKAIAPGLHPIPFGPIMDSRCTENIQEKNGIDSKKEGSNEAYYHEGAAVSADTGSTEEETQKHPDPSAEVNMDVTVTTEDVIRAGGYGARDGLNSFLPIASDATDFEATLLDAREYEEPLDQGETKRPGLGWKDAGER